MEHGRVKWFNAPKGYGFITADSGKDYFVHWTGFSKSIKRAIEIGNRVTFDVQESEKSLKAVNVKLADPKGV